MSVANGAPAPGQPAPMPKTLDAAGLHKQLVASAQHLPPGRPGNLTPEQDAALKDMWGKMLEIWGLHKHESAAPAPVSPVEKKKSRGFFGGGGKKEEDAGEKYGDSKTYVEAMATMTPEELHSEFYRMAKQDAPDAAMLRFLRARKWDAHAAVVMLISNLHWRARDMKIDDVLMLKGEAGILKEAKEGSGDQKKDAEDFIAQFHKGKSFCHGTDKEGRPCNYVRVRLHHGGEQSISSIEQFTVYLIETTRFMVVPPVDTATIVFDMTGFSMANMDYTPVKFMIKCFEANYPESLGAILIYKAPWIFQGIWKIIKGWLDPVVAGKVHFASNINDLSNYIDRSKIMKELDGGEDFTWSYTEPNLNENDIMKDTATRDRIQSERNVLVKEFDKVTTAWVKGEDVSAQRTKLTLDLHLNYYQLDPYVRGRSFYDRLGYIPSHNQLGWDPAAMKAALPNGSA